MVSIFTGAGFGLARGSAAVLGSAGQLGQASTGRAGTPVSVNAASGALNIAGADEMLIGRGPDQVIGMSYSSTSGFGWLQNWGRSAYGLTGTVNTAGSTVKMSGEYYDSPVFTYDSARGAYVSKEGAGAYDELKFANGVWAFTDGNTQTTDYYEFQYAAGYFAITRRVDSDGNTQTYTYNGNQLSRITNANGDYTEMSYVSGTVLPTEIKTFYANGGGTSSLTRVRYTYDASNRVASTIVDLSPTDNSIADGKTYVTSYTYDGTSKRIASVTQADGSVLAIAYDASGRVLTLTETISAGVARTTTLAYFAGYTTVTDATGGVTRLDYDAQGQLTKITQPPALSGAASQIVQFAYNSNGDVTSTTDALGNTTTFTYDFERQRADRDRPPRQHRHAQLQRQERAPDRMALRLLPLGRCRPARHALGLRFGRPSSLQARRRFRSDRISLHAGRRTRDGDRVSGASLYRLAALSELGDHRGAAQRLARCDPQPKLDQDHLQHVRRARQSDLGQPLYEHSRGRLRSPPPTATTAPSTSTIRPASCSRARPTASMRKPSFTTASGAWSPRRIATWPRPASSSTTPRRRRW